VKPHELDRLVEEDYGASIPDLIRDGRHQQRSAATSAVALDRIITAHDAAITHGRRHRRQPGNLMRSCFAAPTRIWIKARAGRSHEPRPNGPGDFRPMGAKPRRPWPTCRDSRSAPRRLFGAEAEIDTSGEAIEQSFASFCVP